MFVVIPAAKEEYEELKKELSRISRRSSVPASKLEEGTADENEFNLSEFLHDMSRNNSEAGHELKHLGVIWKNLSVEVIFFFFFFDSRFKKY